MRHVLRALVVLVQASWVAVVLSCSSRPAAPDDPGPQEAVVTNSSADAYLIEPGDVLKFEFPNHSEYTRGVTVRPDSMVTLPLLGDIKAGGRRPEELALDTSARYRPILRYPAVTVEVVSSPNQIVYVGGEVKTPGMYPVSPGKTALQTIIEAGGPTAEAAKHRAYLLRDQGAPRPLFVALDLGGTHSGFELQPKDILVVPMSNIANANQFVDQYINKLIPFSKSLGVSYFIGTGLE